MLQWVANVGDAYNTKKTKKKNVLLSVGSGSKLYKLN